MTEKKKRLVLLDAHAIIHRAYHALPDFSSSKGEPTGGLYGLVTMLIKLVGDLKPDYLVAAYDLPGPTHRHIAYEAYKAGRKKADEELVSQLKRSRDIFTAMNVPIYDAPGFEADDILGTIVEQVKIKNSKLKIPDVDVIIASGDMDTVQLVSGENVKVFTLRKGINDTITYDEEAVLKRFGFGPKLIPDYKGLCGDPSDNIIGVKGIGEKTATDLIKNFGTIEEIYKRLNKDKKSFEKAGIRPRVIELLEKGKEEALFSKLLATIRTDAPIEFKLPEKSWRDGVDLEKANKLFAELEFRALPARFRAVLEGKDGAVTKGGEKEGTKEKEGEIAGQTSASDSLFPVIPAISADDKVELGTMAWLLNSNRTAPTAEEIFEITEAKTAAEARDFLSAELKKTGAVKVYEEIEKPLFPVVKKMNEKGVLIDKAHFKKLSLDYHKKLYDLESKIWEFADEKFNVASPKQLGEILFVKLALKAKYQKKTAGGALSTKESELEKIRDLHPIVSLILEHRELSKLLGTYIDPMPLLADKDGRLHTTFIQAGAMTGRMASRDPNLQNIPNKSDAGREIREGFIAPKGSKLVAFDYSQMELRIAAFLSGDPKLIEIFKAGSDVHSAVASQVFNVPLSEVTKDMRRQAKVINFGVIYGMGVNALKTNLGTDPSTGSGQVSRQAAQAFYDNYFETFSVLAKYLEEVKATAAKQGFTETYFGRRRYFEGLRSRIPYVKASAERMAINAPMQGTGADIIKIAMVRVDEFLQANPSGSDAQGKEKLAEKVSLLLQVHDELVYEVEEKLVAEVAPEIKKIMEGILPLSETRGVPITVDFKAGDNWGDMRGIGIMN